jgi:SAM-dependent methyltransferase
MKSWVPWYGKIAAKLLLSRLPIEYSFWRRLNLFAHGAMHRPEYACGVFWQHFKRAAFGRKTEGFVALEVGPGDSLLSALIAKAHGAIRCYLIDTAPFATDDLRPYRAVTKYLNSLGLQTLDLTNISDISAVLAYCNASYGTSGLNSLRAIPSASVDFIWSHAVLEHIRRHEFADFVRELRRVLRPDGVCSHRVDLRDHLGGRLNNLRIPSRYWEADWMARSGFYTNRIRYEEMLGLFRQADFDVDIIEVERWKRVPTPTKRMTREFNELHVEDLRVSGFDVVLKPNRLQSV